MCIDLYFWSIFESVQIWTNLFKILNLLKFQIIQILIFGQILNLFKFWLFKLFFVQIFKNSQQKSETETVKNLVRNKK
jgi:hypothetical protein